MSTNKTDEYYMDIQNIVDNIEDNINCIGARFLNKCTINNLIKYDYEYDKKFMERINIK